MNKKKITNKLTIILFLSILFSGISIAATDVPIMPPSFYGSATVNGRDVPVDSIIIAEIDEEPAGEITVEEAGYYGDDESDYKLGVIGTSQDTGKEIKFYMKMPGYLEMEATETATWQSSKITELSLTFDGDEVVDPNYVPPNNDPGTEDGGSGGSGGTSAGGGAPPQTKTDTMSFYYDFIDANKQLSITFDNMMLVKFQLLLKNKIDQVDLDFEVLDSADDLSLDDVYKYISIDAPKITEDDVDTAIIKFKIMNEWFTDNNYDPDSVKLMRYHDGEWQELELLSEGSDANAHYYRAGTPGFSYFGVTAEKLSSEQIAAMQAEKEEQDAEDESVDNDAQPAAETDGDGAASITGMAVNDDEIKTNPLIGMSIVALVIVLGILAYVFIFRRK